MKSEGTTRAGRGKDTLEGMMEDEIGGREDRKKAHRGWIGRGLGRGKDWDQNMATGKAGARAGRGG